MKKLSLIIFLLIFFQFIASSQTCIPCLPNGIVFTTQSQIDSFQIIYPGCTEIEGYVEIYGVDITNLNGLSVLTSIGGILYIGDNPALTSLSGLDNVTSIGEVLNIYTNASLTNLSGLDNVTSIGGDLYVTTNASLTSLSGLDNVASLGGLNISNNAILPSLSGLDNVTSIGEDLLINANASLTSLSGLDNVASIGKDLYIRHNGALTSLLGLDNMNSIEGTLWIENNDALISLIGLDNIDAESIEVLHIIDNYSLSACAVQSICDYLVAPGGDIEISNNAPGCNSVTEVEVACEALTVENINFEEGSSIYPNPANHELFIYSTSKALITEVTIYNQIGQKVLHHKSVIQPIDVSMLRPGVYIIEVCSHDFKVRKKLIIR